MFSGFFYIRRNKLHPMEFLSIAFFEENWFTYILLPL